MKKKRSRHEGLALARAYQNSGLGRREFSQRHGVTECSVQYWQKQLSRNEPSGAIVNEAQFIEVKQTKSATAVAAAKVQVGSAEISFLSLPEASWMSEFVVTVNRYS
ncbi:MAG: hypothetical protein JXR76_07445 [Deltaproteobacteria bacterium]|nr:hypothetical protein [Deltaproteobacteria bacterium]